MYQICSSYQLINWKDTQSYYSLKKVVMNMLKEQNIAFLKA